ncbi:MAG: Smr/MutS family protein [Methyloligellaceae bacterium]
MATAKPLKKKPTHRQISARTGDKVSQTPVNHSTMSKKTDGRTGGKPERSLRPSKPPMAGKVKTRSPLGTFDRRQLRQIASGREDIEARLDLHGLRQREAYQALRAFLFSAQSAGKRIVLVITGKGSGQTDAETDLLAERERGVLKRLVPQWLGEDGFRALIVSYSTANARHGGDGALYIRLRRARAFKE